MDAVSFTHPWVLMLLWAVLLIGVGWLLMISKRHLRLQKMVSPMMAQKLSPTTGRGKQYLQAVLLTLSAALIVISAAGPSWGLKEEVVHQRSRDVMIVLDVSRSMLAEDVRPNRLVRAKADIVDLIRSLDGDRAGLIAFRSSAELLCPLTTDYGFLQYTLDAADIDSARRGETDIGHAVRKALDMFDDDLGSHKAIVLITDGEDLSGSAAEAAKEAAERGIRIFTVGFGSSDGAAIPNPIRQGEFLQHDGRAVVSRLGQETLAEIAKISDGLFIPVATANINLGDMYTSIRKQVLERDTENTVVDRRVDRYQYFLLPAILLLLISAALSQGRPRTTSRKNRNTLDYRHSAIAVMLATSLCGASLHAQENTTELQPSFTNPRDNASVAMAFYAAEDYNKAADAYLSAAANAEGGFQRQCYYNAAAALYRAERYEEMRDVLTLIKQRWPDHVPPNLEYERGLSWMASAEEASSMATNAASIKLRALERASEAFIEQLDRESGHTHSRKALTRLETDLEDQRQAAQMERLMKQYGNEDMFALLDSMMNTERELLDRTPEAFGVQGPDRIDALETLAAEQKENSLKTRVLKQKLGDAQLPPDQQAMLQTHLSNMEAGMNSAWRGLRDLDSQAFMDMQTSERGLYDLWKGIAPHDKLIQEDSYQQTNLIAATSAVISNASPPMLRMMIQQQDESMKVSQLFKERFIEAVPDMPEGETPTSNTEALQSTQGTENTEQDDGMTPEKRKEIIELTDRLIAEQSLSSSQLLKKNLQASLSHQLQSAELIERIKKLINSSNNQNQQNDDQQEQPQDNQDQNQDNNNDQQDQNQQDPQDNQQQDPNQNDQQQDPQDGDQQDAQQQPSDPRELRMSEDQAKAILEKARQREQQYQDEKRAQRRQMEIIPIDRDW